MNFVQVEFLKLKRSKMFIISLFGAIFPSFVLFLSMLYQGYAHPGDIYYFKDMFNDIIFYYLMVFAVILYTVIIAYLFSIEYREHTLKSILTSPVSKNMFIITKLSMFFIWVFILTLIAFMSSIFLLYLGGCIGLTFGLSIKYLFKFLTGSILLSLSISPFAFLSVLFKRTLPIAIGGATLSLLNSIICYTKISPLFPWSSPILFATGELASYDYGTVIPLLIILLTFVTGVILTLSYFNLSDDIL